MPRASSNQLLMFVLASALLVQLLAKSQAVCNESCAHPRWGFLAVGAPSGLTKRTLIAMCDTNPSTVNNALHHVKRPTHVAEWLFVHEISPLLHLPIISFIAKRMCSSPSLNTSRYLGESLLRRCSWQNALRSKGFPDQHRALSLQVRHHKLLLLWAIEVPACSQVGSSTWGEITAFAHRRQSWRAEQFT